MASRWGWRACSAAAALSVLTSLLFWLSDLYSLYSSSCLVAVMSLALGFASVLLWWHSRIRSGPSPPKATAGGAPKPSAVGRLARALPAPCTFGLISLSVVIIVLTALRVVALERHRSRAWQDVMAHIHEAVSTGGTTQTQLPTKAGSAWGAEGTAAALAELLAFPGAVQIDGSSRERAGGRGDTGGPQGAPGAASDGTGESVGRLQDYPRWWLLAGHTADALVDLAEGRGRRVTRPCVRALASALRRVSEAPADSPADENGGAATPAGGSNEDIGLLCLGDALVRIGDPAAADVLARLAAASTRLDAASAPQPPRWSPRTALRPALSAALTRWVRTGDAEEAVCAAETPVYAVDERSIPGVARAAGERTEARVRAACFPVLATAPWQSAAADGLLRGLSSEAPAEVRESAAEAMVVAAQRLVGDAWPPMHLEEPTAGPSDEQHRLVPSTIAGGLIVGCEDPSPEVRTSCATALVILTGGHLTDEDRQATYEAFQDAVGTDDHAVLISVLGGSAGPRATALRTALGPTVILPAMSSGNESVRVRAINAARDLPGVPPRDALQECLHDRSTAVRRAAALALLERTDTGPDERAVEVLIASFEVADAPEQRKIARALAGRPEDRVTGLYLKLLWNPSMELRGCASRHFAERPNARAIKGLAYVFFADPHMKDIHAETALAKLGVERQMLDEHMDGNARKAMWAHWSDLVRNPEGMGPFLIRMLNAHGGPWSAKVMLNSGSPEFEQAARRWARRNGYEVVGALDWPGPRWPSE